MLDGVVSWVFLLLQGITMTFLFTALHECVHLTAFRTRWINDLTAYVCGFLLLLPSRWFRLFHFDHHRFTQDLDKDPELSSAKPDSWPSYILHMSGVPYWWRMITGLAKISAGARSDRFITNLSRNEVRLEAIVLMSCYAFLFGISVYFESTVLWQIWVLPALLGQPFLRLYLLAEHGGCPLTADMFENSRTVLTNPVVRFFAWNMPYHAEHHALPSVPFHRLGEMHDLVKDHLAVVDHGYIDFHRKYQRVLTGGNPRPADGSS